LKNLLTAAGSFGTDGPRVKLEGGAGSRAPRYDSFSASVFDGISIIGLPTTALIKYYHNREDVVSHFKIGAYLGIMFLNLGVNFGKDGFAHG
jgi:hypothetical protein